MASKPKRSVVPAVTSGLPEPLALVFEQVRVEVLVSHDGVFIGDVIDVPLDERTTALINMDYLSPVFDAPGL